MKIFDKVLENNRSYKFDYSHIPINAFHVNTNSSLTLLVFILDLTPLDQSFTSILNTTLL